MGCASSSPLMNSPGGVVESAKKAAGDVMHAGEDAMHDVGDSIKETAGQVKDAVVGAVQSVGHGLDGITGKKDEAVNEMKEVSKEASQMMNGEHIPLKDDNMMDHVEDNLEEFKKDFLKKTQDFNDDTEKLTDEIMKETDDIMGETMDNAKNKINEQVNGMKNGANDIMESMKNELDNMKMENGNKTPTHSIDSLKTGTPESEIERILSTDDIPQSPTPKHTHSELPDMNPTVNDNHNNGNDMKNQEIITTEIYSKNFTTLTGKNNTKQILEQLNSNNEIIDIELDDEYNNNNNDNNINDDIDTDEENNNTTTPLPPPTSWEELADMIVPVLPPPEEEELLSDDQTDEKIEQTVIQNEESDERQLEEEQTEKQTEQTEIEIEIVNQTDEIKDAEHEKRMSSKIGGRDADDLILETIDE